MEILVSFDKVDPELSNDTKLMSDFIHWEVIVKKVKKFPKMGSELQFYSIAARRRSLGWKILLRTFTPASRPYSSQFGQVGAIPSTQSNIE